MTAEIQKVNGTEERPEKMLPSFYEWSPLCKAEVCSVFIGRTRESKYTQSERREERFRKEK